MVKGAGSFGEAQGWRRIAFGAPLGHQQRLTVEHRTALGSVQGQGVWLLSAWWYQVMQLFYFK